MVKANELRKMNKEELIKRKAELVKQVVIDSFAVITNKNKKTAQLRSVKKDLARIETVLTEQKIIHNIQENESSS